MMNRKVLFWPLAAVLLTACEKGLDEGIADVAGIKMHTLYEIQTDIPTFIHITEAKVHDQRAMDEIPYEQGAYYVFDRGYFDLKRLYHINEIEAYFVIRQRGNLQYQVVGENDTMHNADGVLSDQIIRLTGYQTSKKFPAVLRRVTYYAADKNKTFNCCQNPDILCHHGILHGGYR